MQKRGDKHARLDKRETTTHAIILIHTTHLFIICFFNTCHNDGTLLGALMLDVVTTPSNDDDSVVTCSLILVSFEVMGNNHRTMRKCNMETYHIL